MCSLKCEFNFTFRLFLVIQSGHFLKVMETTKDLSQQWIKRSKEFEAVLISNQTQARLRYLLQSMDRFPFMYDPRYADIPLSDKNKVLSQLPAAVRQHIRHKNVSQIIEGMARYGSSLIYPDSLIYPLSNISGVDIEDYIEEYNRTGWLHVSEVRKHMKSGIQAMLRRSNRSDDIELLDQLHKINYMAKVCVFLFFIYFDVFKFNVFYFTRITSFQRSCDVVPTIWTLYRR